MLKFSTLLQKIHPNSAQKQSPASPDQDASPWTTLAEGELLIDMYEKPNELVIRSLVAGVQPEDIEISLHNDMLTIRGARKELDSEVFENQFFYRECYWGEFSRTIILPTPVDAASVQAYFINGVMMIVLQKTSEQKAIRPETIENNRAATSYEEDEDEL